MVIARTIRRFQLSKLKGVLLEEWCHRWEIASHNEKQLLASEAGVTYESARHLYSDAPVDYKKVSNIILLAPQSSTAPYGLKTPKPMTTMVILGDTHNPYQDDKVVALVERFLADCQPDYLVYNGDINDFYQVSVYSKDPTRLGSLQQDFDVTTGMFARHAELLPNTKKIFSVGTHEVRWIHYLEQHAPALAKLNATKIEEIYKLKEYDIEYVPYEQGILVNGVFLIVHGDIVAQHSSYTAKRQYDKQGGNGLCNHTHRGGSYYKRDRFGVYGWWENFCLCRLDPDWLPNPDWIQGFSVVHFSNTGRFWVEQVPIINYKFIFGGKLYE